MSVAGDIIDDLAIGPKFKLKAMTGSCGALAVFIFVGIGVSGVSAAEEQISAQANGVKAQKTQVTLAGGIPRPR